MVRPEQYERITLIDKRIIHLNGLAKLRQDNAVEVDREPGYGAPTEYNTALQLNAVGLYGEGAGMVLFNRLFQGLYCVYWNMYRKQGIYGRAELQIHRFGKPPFAFADTKTNQRKYAENFLQVTDKAIDHWIYVLCYVESFPVICIVGWCLGMEAKTSPKFKLNPKRPESYNTVHSAEILKPMSTLRKYVLELEQRK